MVNVLNKQLTEMTGETLYTTQVLGVYPFYALEIYGKSVQNGTPTPDAPVDIISIGDDGAVEVASCGKNLLPSAKVEAQTKNGITITSNGDGSYHISGTSTSEVSIVFNLTAITLPQESIYLSLNNSSAAVNQASIAFVSEGTNIESASFNEINRKYKLSNVSGKKITGLLFYVKSGATVDITCKPQLELNGYTDFEPYKGSAATITSGLPLCSVGDVHDELIYNADGTGKIVKHIKKAILSATDSYPTLNGNKITHTQASSNTAGIIRLGIKSADIGIATDSPIICSDYENAHSYYGTGIIYGTDYTYLRDDSLPTIDDWFARLAANPITLLYQLATPQEIELSAAEMAKLQQLETLDGICNIYNSGNGEMYIRAMTADFEYGHEVGFFDSKL